MDRVSRRYRLGSICVAALSTLFLPAIPAAAQAPNTARTHQPFKISPTDHTDLIRLGTFEQTRHWAPMASWTNPAFDHGEDPSTRELFSPHPNPCMGIVSDPLLGSPLAVPLAPIRNNLDRLYVEDVKVEISDVLVYQNVSRTMNEAAHNSLFNRFNVSMHVRAWGLPDHGDGIFTMQLRVNTNVLDTETPGEAVGSFSPLDDIANDTTFLINRFEFEQAFLDKHLQVTIGKGNPNDVIASNLFAWDEVHEFMSITFDGGNYPTGYGGYMPLISVQAIPVDGIYMTGIVTSGLGTAYQLFSTLGEGLYWCAGEVGTVVEIGEDKLQGRYSIALMNSNTGPETVDHATRTSGNAMAIVLQQQVAPSTAIWSQYLLCSENIGPAEQEFTIGLSIENCFDRKEDGFGIAFGWSKPSGVTFPDWRENLQFETYYRLQLTKTWQLSPDFQFLPFPSNPDSEKKPVYSFALRLTTMF